MPVTVAVVLVFVPRVGLGGIILASGARLCRQDRGPGIQIEPDLTLQVNRKAGINAGWKAYDSAAGSCDRFNRFIDGRRVDRRAVALSAKGSHVVNCFACMSIVRIKRRICWSSWQSQGA